MGRGDAAGARAGFSPDLAEHLDADQLAAAWQVAVGPLGGLVRVADVETAGHGEQVTAELDAGVMLARVRFAPGGEAIVALHLALSKPRYRPAPYAESSRFTASSISLHGQPRTLPGTLLRPVGAGPFPTVVFVPGAGRRDRDGSDGGPRLFRDLAEGLASAGIASIRYEKRTFGHVSALDKPAGHFTIRDEYLDDLDAALALARASDGLDGRRLWLVGHSLGGHLVPVLLAGAPDLAGGVVLAGHARSVLEVIVDQAILAAGRASSRGDREGALSLLQRLEDQLRRVEDPALDPDTPIDQLPSHIPARYWLSLRGLDAVAAARAVPQPLLFLHGERDIHVSPTADLERWRTAVAGKSNARLILYPRLNHSLVAGEDTASGAQAERHMDQDVVRAVAAFIDDAG